MNARRERGAALLLLMSVLVVVAAAAGVALLEQAAAREPGQWDEQQRLVLAADALRGAAFQRRCVTPALAPDVLLACPETGGGVEGVAAASCPGVSRGWLPWRTLGLPPLRDGSGTCLWFERSGSTARIIAPGAPRAGQDRTTLPGRTSCAGNAVAANYLDAGDAEVSVVLDLAQIAAACP
jgi:hypothetical protein